MTDDLAVRVLAAIEGAAGAAQADLDDPRSLHARRKRAHEALRHCEADRRTVQRHEPQRGSGPYGRLGCQWCSSDDRPTSWPCPDLLDRAAAYDVTTEETA